MTTYFVTAHPGAVEWARQEGIDATPLAHLDPARLCSGDTVIGNLPVHVVAAICARGSRYLHLCLDVPEGSRRRELTAEEMVRFGARVEEYEVRRV